jgi:hypothetical protein
LLPDFFVQPNDIARAGFSQPVSDISFSECSDQPVMLLAERGGIRNLGLAADNPFAYPHEARALRYELDTTGVWRPVGRYDVGFYDRKNEGQPFLRANCAGGIAFAPGYTPDWTMDLAKTDQFVLDDRRLSVLAGGTVPSVRRGAGERPSERCRATGCRAGRTGWRRFLGPRCPRPGRRRVRRTDAGGCACTLSGRRRSAYPATGPDQSYLIDTDINVDDAGRLIEDELLRNDATKIGDVAIYEMCAPRRQVAFLPPPPLGTAPPDLVGHDPDRSHFLIASHEIGMSHYRFGSHNPYWSHNRFCSHNPHWSHSRRGSHNSHWSHSRRGSHSTAMSHHTPPHGHHLVAISSRNPPHTKHKPPTTAGGSPGSQFGGTCSTVNGKTTCTGSGPPPTTTGQGGKMFGGTCSTVNGKTTCTGTGPPPSPSTSSSTQSQTGSHQLHTHNAAISRQGSSHTSGQSSTTSSHTTSSTTTKTSHTTTRTSHTSHTVSHTRRVSTSSHGRRTASYAHRSRSGSSGFRSGGRGFGGGGFRGGGRGRHSDIRLKEDIALLERLDNGIGVYRFRYRGGDPTIYVGVMAQEVQQVAPSAVTRGSDGYLRVRYERIGAPFMTWAAWLRAHRPLDRNDAVGLNAHGP